MEQIILTKEELKQIVENAVNKKMQQETVFKPNRAEVFKATKLQQEDFQKINFSNEIVRDIECTHCVKLGYPISTKTFGKDWKNVKKRTKVHSDAIHDLLRKLSLSILGYSLNSDLDYKEFEKANQLYTDFKEFYLTKYQERVDEIDIWDFE